MSKKKIERLPGINKETGNEELQKKGRSTRQEHRWRKGKVALRSIQDGKRKEENEYEEGRVAFRNEYTTMNTRKCRMGKKYAIERN